MEAEHLQLTTTAGGEAMMIAAYYNENDPFPKVWRFHYSDGDVEQVTRRGLPV